MSRCNILITGAGGFVGQALVKQLINSGHHIYALDINPLDSCTGDKIKKFYRQDLSQPFTLEETFDFVFHLGAYNFTHAGSPQKEAYHRINVLGTENLLNSSNIKNFIFLSTAKVYKLEGKFIDEDSSLGPVQDYEKSKLEAEDLCRKQFQGKNLCVFRSVNIAGPNQAEKAVLPVLFRNAEKGNPLDIFAPKESILQFIYVKDIIQLFLKFIEQGGLSGTFNVYSTNTIRLDQLAYRIVKLMQSDSPVNFSNHSRVIFSEVISKRLMRTFGWQPQTKIEEILQLYQEHFYLKSHDEN